MLTYIKTIHEEVIPDSDNIIGILLNSAYEDETYDSESFIYIYKKSTSMYIFFNTMVDMIDYYFYGNEKCKRAYLKESLFDTLYSDPFEDRFTDHLEWV
jgi:hypothetical protein